MTLAEYVARELLPMLHKYDARKDGSYVAYISRICIAAYREAEKMGLK